MKYLILLIVFFTGCAMYQIPQYFANDDALQKASLQLSQDFLDGQMNGEGYANASYKYGQRIRTFSNLVDYSIQGTGCESGDPAVFVRLKLSNKLGGEEWMDQVIRFDYDLNLRNQNDKYLGLRIKDFGSTVHRFMEGMRYRRI